MNRIRVIFNFLELLTKLVLAQLIQGQRLGCSPPSSLHAQWVSQIEVSVGQDHYQVVPSGMRCALCLRLPIWAKRAETQGWSPTHIAEEDGILGIALQMVTLVDWIYKTSIINFLKMGYFPWVFILMGFDKRKYLLPQWILTTWNNSILTTLDLRTSLD